MTTRIAFLGVLALAACDADPGLAAGETMTSLESMSRLCPWESACAPVHGPIGDCLSGASNDDLWGLGGSVGRGQIARIARCAATAADCVAYQACEAAAFAGPAGPACDETFVNRCDGAVLTACIQGTNPAERVQVEVDCREAGAEATCTGTGPEARCDANCTVGEAKCSGSVMMACDAYDGGDTQFVWRLDCGAEGLACSTRTGCLDRSPGTCARDACDGPFVRRCLGGRTASFDCRVVDPGFACYLDSEQPRCGLPTEVRECDPWAFGDETCEGSRATTCVWGKRVTVDCAAVPGGTCQVADGNARCAFVQAR